jgi:large subunit ribosomal protein L33
MSQDNLIKLQCSGCKRFNYWSRKSAGRRTQGGAQRKIELKKFCGWCRKHIPHKEVKK